jgi:hypothetical protein
MPTARLSASCRTRGTIPSAVRARQRSGASQDKGTVPVTPDAKSYRPGRWILIGTVLGAFIGLLVEKFAIGMIAGFFVGILVDSAKRKSAPGTGRGDAGDRPGN